jgi:tetratricopeptide (TPR) repeat protein
MKISFTCLVAVVLFTGCNKPPPEKFSSSTHTPSSATVSAAIVAPPPPPKLVQEGPRTTSAGIAIGNLESQIQSFSEHIKKHPDIAETNKQLTNLLLTRGQYLGKIEDYEKAMVLAEAYVKSKPAVATGYILRASVRSTFHQFEKALEDIDKARSLKAKPFELDQKRAAIYQAQGRYDDAKAILTKLRFAEGLSVHRAQWAALEGEMGDSAAAHRDFALAFEKYRNTSPFPYAWMLFLEGSLYEKEGKSDKAKELFTKAYKRLPQYAHVVAHLAGLQAPAKAAELLIPITKQSDDPAYLVQLSDAYKRLDRKDEAKSLLESATKRYEQLLTSYPEAFANHGVGFWLGSGGDPKKAFELAGKNLAIRKTAEAYELYITAALAAKEKAAACKETSQALKLKYKTSSLEQTLKPIAQGCKK